MAYKIKYHGYDVACDTVDDLRALVNENGASPSKSAVKAPVQESLSKTSADVGELIAKLKKEQRDLVRHIATGGRISRDRLRQLVGISDPHQFAGILISISKSAAGAGMKSPIEILYERENGRGKRTYQYKIRDDVKAAVKEALVEVQ